MRSIERSVVSSRRCASARRWLLSHLFTVLGWTNFHKIDLGKWPNIKAFMARVGARPKVQETLKAEGLVK